VGVNADPTDVVLKALAEPRRRAILELVSSEELAAGEIAAAFEVTRPAVSQHLQVLREAGLVTERRDGTRRLYRVESSGIALLRSYLEGLWDGALATAKRLAEAEGAADPVPQERAG
jgi:DNA-binding transcriptional ArsR family regulator